MCVTMLCRCVVCALFSSGVLCASEDVCASELGWTVGVIRSGKRRLVCLVCKSGCRALVNMSAVFSFEPTPPIRMPFSM